MQLTSITATSSLTLPLPLLTSSLYHFTVCQSQHQTTETVCNHCGQTPHMPSLRMATTNFMFIHKSIHSQKLNKEITDDCHDSLTNTASITQQNKSISLHHTHLAQLSLHLCLERSHNLLGVSTNNPSILKMLMVL